MLFFLNRRNTKTNYNTNASIYGLLYGFFTLFTSIPFEMRFLLIFLLTQCFSHTIKHQKKQTKHNGAESQTELCPLLYCERSNSRERTLDARKIYATITHTTPQQNKCMLVFYLVLSNSNKRNLKRIEQGHIILFTPICTHTRVNSHIIF